MFRVVFLSLLLGAVTLLAGVLLLYPATSIGDIEKVYLDWVSYTPWRQSSINTHLGTTTSKPMFYPVPIVACLIALSLLAYTTLLLASRAVKSMSNISFDWRVVATLTIVGWVCLDLMWQARLLRQLQDTQKKFSGIESREKLALAPDRRLFNFIDRVKQKVDTPNPRFFLITSDDYYGVRGAYHLYPENVYWKRRDPKLPLQKYLHQNDYIVLVRPTEIHFDRHTQALPTPDQKTLPVEPLMVENMGGLFRVR